MRQTPCTECYGNPDLVRGCDHCGRPPRPRRYIERCHELAFPVDPLVLARAEELAELGIPETSH